MQFVNRQMPFGSPGSFVCEGEESLVNQFRPAVKLNLAKSARAGGANPSGCVHRPGQYNPHMREGSQLKTTWRQGGVPFS